MAVRWLVNSGLYRHMIWYVWGDALSCLFVMVCGFGHGNVLVCRRNILAFWTMEGEIVKIDMVICRLLIM